MVSITFESVPAGAAVFLDNTDYGVITPVTLDIDEGGHTYILRITPRYEDIAGQVTVIAGLSYTLIATMKETTIAMQKAFNDSMVRIGWYSFIVGATSLFIGMLKKKGA